MLRVFAAILIAMAVQIAPSAALETERLNQVIAACGECHGLDGISVDPEIPNLAGQDSLYMENQLDEFRHKSPKKLERFQLDIRDSHTMDSQSMRFDGDDLAAMYRYFSDMRCAVENRPAGDTDSIICGECHGNDGVGREPGIPNLAGQKEAYLLAQLQIFKATMLQRGKVLTDQSGATDEGAARRYHRTMGQWAARLNEADMIVAARYYSGLPGIWVCR